MTHQLYQELLARPVTIALAGAGGNGSQMLTGLARLHVSLLALGHPYGLRVRVWDDDTVSRANLGRQLFSAVDIGQPKAAVLVNRLNAYFGLDWQAVTEKLTAQRRHPERVDILIGCVDSKAARRELHQVFANCRCFYWLDLGNEAHTGQVILGENKWCNASPKRLPTITDLFPEILREDTQEDDTPSCSLAAALERQHLFINQSVVTFALNLLWRLFRFGEIDHHGYFVNLESGVVTPLPIDPKGWARFGYSATP